ncbi:MAG: FKBP-type peptidyl-prolyl cis-trans isomerase [Candidatus Scalindua sp.]|nr:FKBP-type peptidyl-prolyl cis-trans isomerase [Candidatus Scalindua sp.]
MKLCFMKKWIIVGSLVCSFMGSGSKAALSELQHEENAAVETTKKDAAHFPSVSHTKEVEGSSPTVETNKAEATYAESPIKEDEAADVDKVKDEAAQTEVHKKEDSSIATEESQKKEDAAISSETLEDKELTVSDGKVVSLEYTLMLEDKSVADSNVGSEPLNYVHGSQDIIPGLELALAGMKVGESKHVVVKPDNGYGPVDQEKFLEISKDKLPPDALKVGTPLQGKNASGTVVNAWVAEIKDDKVILNFNHRLAGKTLYFDVKVVDIKEVDESAKSTGVTE